MEKKRDENIVITIGREMGSGGRQIGMALARRLGYDYYDKELLAEAARNTGMSREFFEMHDERAPSLFNGMIPFTFGMSAHAYFTGGSVISSDGIYRAQSDLIEMLPDKGNCVIVGRSADFVLRHHPRLVSIFITAPMGARIKRIIEREPSLSVDKARVLAEKTDKLRANYYNFYTDSTWGAASTYDLTIDSSLMPVDDIVALIVDYINLRFKNIS